MRNIEYNYRNTEKRRRDYVSVASLIGYNPQDTEKRRRDYVSVASVILNISSGILRQMDALSEPDDTEL
jgi:hypothetical protein